jgi:hypothetical protein
MGEGSPQDCWAWPTVIKYSHGGRWAAQSGDIAMASLQLTDVPDAVYERIRQMADASNQSVSAEALALLNKGIQQQEETRQEQARLLAEIRERRMARKPKPGTLDSTAMIREDRNR